MSAATEAAAAAAAALLSSGAARRTSADAWVASHRDFSMSRWPASQLLGRHCAAAASIMHRA